MKNKLLLGLVLSLALYGIFVLRIHSSKLETPATVLGSQRHQHLHRHRSHMPRELRMTYRGVYDTWESSSVKPSRGKMLVTLNFDSQNDIMKDYLAAQSNVNASDSLDKPHRKDSAINQIELMQLLKESAYYLNIKLFEDSIFDFNYLQIPVVYNHAGANFVAIPSLQRVDIKGYKRLKVESKIRCESLFFVASLHLTKGDFPSEKDRVDPLNYRFSVSIAASSCSSLSPLEYPKTPDISEDFYYQFIGDAMPQYGLLSSGEKGFFALTLFLQLLSVLAQHRICTHTKRSQDFGKKLAIETVMMISLSDLIMIFFWMFRYLIVLSVYYAVLTLLVFLKYLIYDQRLMILTWRAHHFEQFQQSRMTVLHKARIFMIKYYALTVLIVASAWVLRYHFGVILLFQCSVWLPQIAKNVRANTRNRISPMNVFCQIGCPSFLSLYMLMCPKNVFQKHPKTALGLIVFGYIFLQILVLLLQGICCARFFIPHSLRPSRHNYYINVLQDDCLTSEDGCPECPICMNPLDEEAAGTVCSGSEAIQIMRAPCKHMFHAKCLQNWMEIKLECPICRVKLPSLED